MSQEKQENEEEKVQFQSTVSMGFCAFHLGEPAVDICQVCGMSVGSNVELWQDKYCLLCKKRGQVELFVQRLNTIFLFLTITAFVLAIFTGIVTLTTVFFVIIPPAVLIYVVQSQQRRLMYRGIPDIERIGPALHMFALLEDKSHFDVAMKSLQNITPAQRTQIEPYFWQSLAFVAYLGYYSMPGDWRKTVAFIWNIDVSEICDKMIERDHTRILTLLKERGISNNAAGFILEILESSTDESYVKLLLESVATIDMSNFSEQEKLETQDNIYIDLDEFVEHADRLGLSTFKEEISKLLEGYEAPPLPENRLEALMTIEQLREKRTLERQRQKEAAAMMQNPESESQES